MCSPHPTCQSRRDRLMYPPRSTCRFLQLRQARLLCSPHSTSQVFPQARRHSRAPRRSRNFSPSSNSFSHGRQVTQQLRRRLACVRNDTEVGLRSKMSSPGFLFLGVALLPLPRRGRARSLPARALRDSEHPPDSSRFVPRTSGTKPGWTCSAASLLGTRSVKPRPRRFGFCFDSSLICSLRRSFSERRTSTHLYAVMLRRVPYSLPLRGGDSRKKNKLLVSALVDWGGPQERAFRCLDCAAAMQTTRALV